MRNFLRAVIAANQTGSKVSLIPGDIAVLGKPGNEEHIKRVCAWRVASLSGVITVDAKMEPLFAN